MKDYYYILGVDANCTTDDIKAAYRKLSKKFHPDVNQNDSYFKSHFIEIQEAYGILSDPDTRKWYDDKQKDTNLYPPITEPPKQRRYPRTTAIDIIFTLVLIGITILFGKYVMASMNGSHKLVKLTKEAVLADTPQIAATPVKHHKKKKHNYIAADYFEKNPAPVMAVKPVVKKAAPAVIVQAAVAKSIVKPPVKMKTDTFKPEPKPVAVVSRPILPVRLVSNVSNNADAPYSSMLRSNITGVVNMRRSGDFNSDVVAVIPNHSKVWVLQKGDNYYKIQFNGGQGYVPKWTVLTK